MAAPDRGNPAPQLCRSYRMYRFKPPPSVYMSLVGAARNGGNGVSDPVFPSLNGGAIQLFPVTRVGIRPRRMMNWLASACSASIGTPARQSTPLRHLPGRQGHIPVTKVDAEPSARNAGSRHHRALQHGRPRPKQSLRAESLFHRRTSAASEMSARLAPAELAVDCL